MSIAPIILIVFREAFEAILIVTALYSASQKLKLDKLKPTIFWAVTTASVLSLGLLILNSYVTSSFSHWLEQNELWLEAILPLVSAIFLTFIAVYFHQTMEQTKLQEKIALKSQIQQGESVVFFLVFTAVLREGLEIVFFLATLYINTPLSVVLLSFAIGLTLAIATTSLLLKKMLRFSLKTFFRVLSLLLILISGGLLLQSLQAFTELRVLSPSITLTLAFLPEQGFFAKLIFSLLGWQRNMDLLQIGLYLSYTVVLVKKLVLNHENPSRS